jgi:transposase
MLPHPSNATQSPDQQLRRIGVGIDTSRYGHYAAFLRDDLEPAAAELQFAESAAGYLQLRQQLELLAQRHGPVQFVIRLDAAGQYADNLLHFLYALGTTGNRKGTDASTEAQPAQAALLALSISCGDPQRNKNYRAALFGNKKSDPLEARAAARYAISERPKADQPMSTELRTLRQVAARLQAACRQRTRLINQLHHLLALALPELALLVKDISTGWVLELLHRYPSAGLLAAASAQQLADVPYLSHQHIASLLQHARDSIASLHGPTMEELVRDQIRQLRDVRARQKRLEKLLVSTYRALPSPNHLDTIPGIGAVTAAVLTAFILDIDRFETPGKLVAYFGTLPIEVSSGVDRDGQARGPKRYVMSRRGNDLVRRYLWMAGLSAVRHNPAVRALYARLVKKHPNKKAIAIGHAMRKLLHLAFAVWKTKRPFDPEHYPWTVPAHLDRESTATDQEAANNPITASPSRLDIDVSQNDQAAGLKRSAQPAGKEVTAACSAESLCPNQPANDSTFIDFAHLKRQLPIARVLDQLGLSGRLRGSGPQKRCTCPLHRGDARGKSFSVHLADNVFCCHDKACGKKGDVIDLWASVHGMSLRQAALDLVETFHLESAP